MDNTTRQLAELWLQRDPDPKTRSEISSLLASDSEAELLDRFAGRLEFGTAGLRGVVGAGSARMNSLVIRETSAGLASYLINTIPQSQQRGILVAYDGRLDSKRFAEDAACVFAAKGIKVYLTDQVTATPVAAFGIQHLNCAAAVVVTASHNPPEYNGYKVYWENGAQIIPPHDSGIAAAIDQAAEENIPWIDYDNARRQGLIELLGNAYYRSYREAIGGSPLFGSQASPKAVSVAYTAMHGVGANMAKMLLNDKGFDKVYSEASQEQPDGHFPTVNFPNPEEPGAMDLVIELARQHECTLACANDPDADRLAVAVRNADGDYPMLSGDQIGVLLGNYALQKFADSEDPRTPILCASIVSSSMLGKLAALRGADFYQTLTGFKWLTNVAQSKQDEEHQFLFAYEEALGYAFGATVWDKDGLSALLAFAQMSAELAAQGKTVLDQLEALYREVGLHKTQQKSIAFSAGGPSVGDKLRAANIDSIGGIAISSTEDLQAQRKSYAGGRSEIIDLPASDVLIYHLENGSRIIVRPSGTEPKLKCYYEVRTPFAENQSFAEADQHASAALHLLVDAHQQQLAQYLPK